MNSPLNICLSLYRRLANAYPHEFRMIYGEDLDRLGEDAVPEAWRRYGPPGLLRLLADIAVRLPVEYLAEIRQDVIYTVRVLARSPGFAAVAVLSLAIGIGMCSVVLLGSNAMLGPPPGVRDPAALVTSRRQVSYPYFEHYRDQRQVASAATAFLTSIPFAIAPTSDRSARADRFYGNLVSPEYFSTLGVTPAAGRFFSPQTEKPGMPPVVVVSDRFWRTFLNSDPQAVGRTVRLNGQLATIVGIAPQDFLGMWPYSPSDVYVPVTCGAAVAPELGDDPLHRPGLEMFRVVLRLPHGVTIPAADAALDAVTLALDRQTPDPDRGRDRKARLLSLMPAGTLMLITPEQRAFVFSFNVVLWALVLALLCANLVNLLLARAGQRRREIAVRLSVGASRARLVRQLLTESVLLSLAGGLGGILLAYWIGHTMSALDMPSQIPVRMDLRPDLRILAFTLAISFLAGAASGLVPALTSLRTGISVVLKEGTQAPLRRYRRFSLRNLFVVSQVAASLMLLLVTGYIVTGYQHSARVDPGFDTANLNLFSIDPLRDGYSTEQSEALFSKLPEELSRVSGVRAVALAGGVPFTNLTASYANTAVSASSGGKDGRPVLRSVFRERIGANYFATLGVPLVRGHEFDLRDQQSDAPPGTATPAIVNQTAARALFGAEDPIGRRIREGEASYTVVGVARDVPGGFVPPKPIATVFLPLTAGWFVKSRAPRATILVRGAGGAVRDRLASLHPDLTVFNVQTMRENLARLNAFVQWSSAVYAVLGLFALLLACVGLGGVTAYAVAQRRKEIGIRVALGARSAQVQRLVLREGTALIAIGALLGIACAAAFARGVSSVAAMLVNVFDTRADDPRLVFGAPLLLAALALLACYLPARRATRIDPVVALREE
jgi:macrolide transport system ATP-binding/permease protein